MMQGNYKKKLIEVAIPLEAINAASTKEKSIRHGHPSTLHLWWARRPLAACRAVLFAQLVDDPSNYPEKFPDEKSIEIERKRLFQIIEELVKWENSTNEEILEKARIEIQKSCGDELPSIYDPFSGGGSIPLEAQRLGIPAYGSDLNPVAVTIGKAMIEIPARFKDIKPLHAGGPEKIHYRNAEGLAEDVKYYGEWVRDQAFKKIGNYYPNADLPAKFGGGKGTIIAWIWARTVPSPDPAFSDAMVPIASSFLLSSKKGKEAWIKPNVDKNTRTISYEVQYGGSKEELDNANSGTKAGRGANFVCVMSGSAITPDYVKAQGKMGNIKEHLIGLVVNSKSGRIFLSPDAEQYEIAKKAEPLWTVEAPLPRDIKACWTTGYGMTTFGDLFTRRQTLALNTFSDLLADVEKVILKDSSDVLKFENNLPLRDGGTGPKAYSEAVLIYLSFVLDKCSDYWSSICTWHSSKELIRNTFGRQVIPMSWDYAETNPFSSSTGNWSGMLDWVTKSLANFVPRAAGSIYQYDAQNVKYPKQTVISTDPPYYDNISYAELSDFFFCWMRPALKKIYPDIFGVIATPKTEELVATPYRHGGKDDAEIFFLEGMRKAISNMSSQSSQNFPATIYYAFKQSEIAQEGISSTGWATFLQAVVESGYAVVGTWPMRTEMANRMIASGTNALANSVVLVCRKKDATADIISRAEFIRLLKRELPNAITELQAANIAPADMPQSAIGPGMGIFSRYKAVLESDDSPMTVKTALQLINRELDDFLNNIVGEFDPDTRFAITWFEQHGMNKGEYGAANSIAQARGISVESVKHAGIVESSAGKVRILKRDELLDDWDPETDKHLTIWECCQYMIHRLEKEGEYEAALLMKKIGSEKAEAVKDLAYCLYDICSNKRKDAKEATSYNGLIAIWTDLTRLAAGIHDTRGDGQMQMQV